MSIFQLVHNFIDDAEQDIFTQKMLNDKELDWHKNLFNSPHTIHTLGSLQETLLASIKLNPQRVAVSDSLRTLSYQELHRHSSSIAISIQSQLPPSTNEQKKLAVFLDRSINMSLALVACVKIGAAYVPCLTDMPEQRLSYIFDDADVSAVVCDNASFEAVRQICHAKQLLCINIDSIKISHLSDADQNFDVNLASNDLLNVIYTSGSTGKPKGVLVTQQGIANRLEWMQKQYPLVPSDRVLQKTPFNFDVSVWELFWPLLHGASLHYMPHESHKNPQEIIQQLRDKSITVCHFVPSMLEVFLQLEDVSGLRSLKQVFSSGEALLQTQVDTFFTRLGHVNLSNLYGPTEASIDVSWHDCQANERSFRNMVSIGKPIDNMQLYILDRHKNIMPKGASGDLYISGAGLARGYQNLPDLTERSFIELDLVGRKQRFYASGDIARINDNAELDYQGRSDQQVKIRGLRIELGEIEQALLQLDNIQQVAVSVKTINQQPQLLAYVVAHSLPDTEFLNAQLKGFLPDFMLPFDYIKIDALPLTANGKLQRKLLPEYQATMQAWVAPRNALDEDLVRLCKQLLSIEKISMTDNFFELGGHSLLATRLLMLVKQQFNIELPLKSVFEMANIAQLSDFISVLLPDTALDQSEEQDDFEEGVL